jgi:hypothetical protein
VVAGYLLVIFFSILFFLWGILAVFDKESAWKLEKLQYKRFGYDLPEHLRTPWRETNRTLGGVLALIASPICFCMSTASLLSNFHAGFFLLGLLCIGGGVVVAFARNLTWRRYATSRSWLEVNRKSEIWDLYSRLIGGLLIFFGLMLCSLGLL